MGRIRLRLTCRPPRRKTSWSLPVSGSVLRGGSCRRGWLRDGEVEDYLVSIEAVATSWQNTTNPNDVDGNGLVGPLDALLVINELNDRMFSNADSSLNLPAMPPPFLDVNNDGNASPLDALLVINALPSTSGPMAASSFAAAYSEPVAASSASYVLAPAREGAVINDDESAVDQQRNLLDAVFADFD